MFSKCTSVINQLQETYKQKFATQYPHILSMAEVKETTDNLWDLLSKSLQGDTKQQAQCLGQDMAILEQQIQKALLLSHPGNPLGSCQQQATDICSRFLQALPEIQEILFTDIRAAYEGDPAAVSEMETLLCYPGIRAITYQRMAHFLHKQGVRILPRMITECAHQLTGIDIHPGAEIGPAFFIDHGTGVVIGETSIIGSHVKLYQGVTLGAKSFPLDEKGHPIKGIKRHPNIGNDVIIYAETTVLGNVTIGDGAVIGANKWITQDVPPHTRID